MFHVTKGNIGMWGGIPTFLYASDQRSAVEQFDERYVGGWHHFKKFKFDPAELTLEYPDDPVLHPISIAQYRDETLVLYDNAWVVVFKLGGPHQVSRMD